MSQLNDSTLSTVPSSRGKTTLTLREAGDQWLAYRHNHRKPKGAECNAVFLRALLKTSGDMLFTA
jgi:hypothetical protein